VGEVEVYNVGCWVVERLFTVEVRGLWIRGEGVGGVVR